MAALDFSMCWDQAGSFEDFEYHLRQGQNGALSAQDWRLVSAWLFEKANVKHIEKPQSGIRLSPPVDYPPEGFFKTPLRAKFNADSMEGQFISAMSPGDTPQPGWSPVSTRSPLSNGNQSPCLSPEKNSKPISVKQPPGFDRPHCCQSEEHPERMDLSQSGGPTIDAILQDTSIIDEQFKEIEEAATKTFDMIMSSMSGLSLSQESSQTMMPDPDSVVPHKDVQDAFDELHMTQEICYSSRNPGSVIMGSARRSQDKLRSITSSSLSLRPDASKGSLIKCNPSSDFELRRKRSTPAALRHASPLERVTYVSPASVAHDHTRIRTPPSIGRSVYSYQYVINPPTLRHSLSLHRMSPQRT